MRVKMARRGCRAAASEISETEERTRRGQGTASCPEAAARVNERRLAHNDGVVGSARHRVQSRGRRRRIVMVA